MERLIEEALIFSGRDFVDESHAANEAKLDFYLPNCDLYIEVKRMHSERSGDQLGRARNVLLAQGENAVRALAQLLSPSN